MIDPCCKTHQLVRQKSHGWVMLLLTFFITCVECSPPLTTPQICVCVFFFNDITPLHLACVEFLVEEPPFFSACKQIRHYQYTKPRMYYSWQSTKNRKPQISTIHVWQKHVWRGTMPSSTTPTAGLHSPNGHQFNSEDICNELQIDTVSGKSSSFSQQSNH